MADREKVIKGLERISEWLFQQYRVVYDGDAPNYYDAYKTVDDAIVLLKEQEAVGGWISVKDRLPEAIKRALVAADFSGVMDVDVAMYCGNGMWESMSGLYPKFSVTHWMPLPEPPEEVSGDG